MRVITTISPAENLYIFFKKYSNYSDRDCRTFYVENSRPLIATRGPQKGKHH